MKQLEVTIMGQSYILGCPDGGEQSLLAAVASVGAGGLWKVPPSSDAYRMIDWVVRTADHAGRPFAVVDKRNAP